MTRAYQGPNNPADLESSQISVFSFTIYISSIDHKNHIQAFMFFVRWCVLLVEAREVAMFIISGTIKASLMVI